MTGGLLGAGVQGCGEIGSGGHSQWNSIRWDLALCGIDIRQHIVITLWQHWIHSITLSACCTHRNLGKARRHRSYRSQGNHSIKAVWIMFPLINRPLRSTFIIRIIYKAYKINVAENKSSVDEWCFLCSATLLSFQTDGVSGAGAGKAQGRVSEAKTRTVWHKISSSTLTQVKQGRQSQAYCGGWTLDYIVTKVTARQNLVSK